MPHTVILSGQRQRDYAHRLIEQAPDGFVMHIRQGGRTSDQNSKMWAMLTDVSRAKPEGRHWTPEIWKAAFMHSLGHEMRFVESLNGSGPFPLGFSSSKLNKSQMSDLIEVIYEYGSRHNVVWMEKDAA